MAAPVLTALEQKAAMSGKKKKKTIKNVLNIPSDLRVQSCIVEINEVKKLSQILERLLSTARLPVNQNAKLVTKLQNCENLNEKSPNQLDLNAEAKNKRNQLSLGVNVLNKNIRKDLISAVLFACDIEPKFLIQHLCSLCDHNKIPYLNLPGLREITRRSLGFPCIALGFKKNFCDFSEAVSEIQSIFETKQVISREAHLETQSESSEPEEEEEEEEEIINNGDNEGLEKNDEIPFTYLYRTSVNERIFVPEKIYSDNAANKSESGFLTFRKDDTDPMIKSKMSQLGISNKIKNKKQKVKFKKLEELVNSDGDDDEVLEVPKKKFKKNWMVDKTGNKQNFRYFPANLMRIPSNPNRMNKNK